MKKVLGKTANIALSLAVLAAGAFVSGVAYEEGRRIGRERDIDDIVAATRHGAIVIGGVLLRNFQRNRQGEGVSGPDITRDMPSGADVLHPEPMAPPRPPWEGPGQV